MTSPCECRDSTTAPHASDSAVQRDAEHIIRDRLAADLGVDLAPEPIHLKAGTPVQVDAASPDGMVLAEIFARQGELQGGQQKKVAIDTLRLITIREERPGARLIVAFADQAAAAYATGGGWVAQALKTRDVEVKIVDIGTLEDDGEPGMAGDRGVARPGQAMSAQRLADS